MNDKTAGRLTTHVLDTSSGRPAAGIAISLHRGHGEKAELLREVRTNDDGRCDGPLLESGDFRAGEYELRFDVGSYFKTSGIDAFYAVVPVAFVVSDNTAHFHVPLLISPFGYSTYRGS